MSHFFDIIDLQNMNSIAAAISSVDRLDNNSYMVNLPGGDQVAVQIRGNLYGQPVFFAHGTPGSRIIPHPETTSNFVDANVCLISHDGRGYGDSPRKQGYRAIDAAHDIQGIADWLGIKEFCIIGRSGGGPNALAAAALLGKRVARVALLSSVAPPEFEGWFDGMHPDNQKRFTDATENPDRLWQVLEERAKLPAEAFLVSIKSQFGSSYPDMQAFIKSHELAVKNGAGGWFDHNV
ncbi:MAG TPA: alpha/beta hydrolase, partial [Candidatus Saccharimonadales bacterium]|nr:alpha/beta hydrolase [Candidatus Saccharimonadales bacterium]